MFEWIASFEGTSHAPFAAMCLALFAAVTHAVFGALQKGRHDPWLTRGAIDISYSVMAVPFALFVFPLPQGLVWAQLAGAVLIHVGYKYAQAKAYSVGDFTVVYPIVRGMGPLVTVIAASVIFAETYSLTQWGGVLLLSGSILALAVVNISGAGVGRTQLMNALGWAVITGFFVALYTTFDAWGIRSTPNPFTFLAWFFVLDGLIFPMIAFAHYRSLASPPLLVPLLGRGVIGGLVAYFSFGSVMLATRIDKVGEAAVLRETSVVFAALIGWLFLGEKTGPVRWVLVILIALGAVVVEFG